MEVNTPIADDIHATDQNAQYDARSEERRVGKEC